MNAPRFDGGVTGRVLTEDTAKPTLAVFGQIISFTDTSSSLVGPDFQGLNLVEPANKIGEFTVTLRDEANGLNDPWGSLEWSYSVANTDVQYLAAGETRVTVQKHRNHQCEPQHAHSEPLPNFWKDFRGMAQKAGNDLLSADGGA